MGGDHGGGHAGGDFRQKVWSMTGGPYCRPVHWRRNTAIAMVGIFLVCIPIAMKSAELEHFLVGYKVQQKRRNLPFFGSPSDDPSSATA